MVSADDTTAAESGVRHCTTTDAGATNGLRLVCAWSPPYCRHTAPPYARHAAGDVEPAAATGVLDGHVVHDAAVEPASALKAPVGQEKGAAAAVHKSAHQSRRACRCGICAA